MRGTALVMLLGLSALSMSWGCENGTNGGSTEPACSGADPRVVGLGYELIERNGSSGVVRLTGTAENYGRSDFVSGEGQQALQILDAAGFEMAAQPFETLATGETVTVVYDWELQLEFVPATVHLHIGYDPDILIDGNPENDDCNFYNNDFEIDTDTIVGWLTDG